MVGTLAGGKKAAATNKAKYGEDFYVRNGRKGGQNGNTGGFASSVIGKDGLCGWERARIAGAKGGSVSRRGSAKNIKKIIKLKDGREMKTINVKKIYTPTQKVSVHNVD